jgi:uncharacterized protein
MMKLGAAVAATALLVVGCRSQERNEIESVKTKPMSHPVYYFEIPVTDMNRAIRFYESLFGVSLTRDVVDGYEMALFPFEEGSAGATGALAKGDVYVPSKQGAIVYFHVDDIKATVANAAALGQPILYPVKDVGANGLVAEIQDSEGNRLALNQPR